MKQLLSCRLECLYSNRKKVVVMIWFWGAGLCAFGQDPKPDQPSDDIIRKGKVFVGTFFNFSTTTTTKDRVNGVDTKTSSVKLGGNFTTGKMLSDHWGILLNLGYNSTKVSTPLTIGPALIEIKEDKSDFIVAPSLRYYRILTEGTYFFVQSTVFASIGTLETDEFDGSGGLLSYSYNTNGIGFGISPGFSYFMGQRLSTEISIGVLGYAYFDGEDDSGNKTTVSTFQSLFYQNTVSLGFVYYF